MCRITKNSSFKVFSIFWCALLTGLQPPYASEDSPAMTAWVATELGGSKVPTYDALTLRFGLSELNGWDGCRSFEAGYRVSGSTLTIDGIKEGKTKNCQFDEKRVSGDLISTVRNAKTYQIEADRMRLIGAEGVSQGVFMRQNKALEHSAWRVAELQGDPNTGKTPPLGRPITLIFNTNGKLNGTAGCNQYTADYAATDDRLTVNQIKLGQRTCSQPVGVMAKEHAYAEALRLTVSTQLEGTKLALKDVKGNIIARLTAEPLADFTGGSIRYQCGEQSVDLQPLSQDAVVLRIGNNGFPMKKIPSKVGTKYVGIRDSTLIVTIEKEALTLESKDQTTQHCPKR